MSLNKIISNIEIKLNNLLSSYNKLKEINESLNAQKANLFLILKQKIKRLMLLKIRLRL